MLRKLSAFFAASVIVAACGSSHSSAFPTGPGDGTADGGDNGEGGNTFVVGEGGATGPCTGLKCQQVNCGSGTTSISGVVWDPAGKNPVYDVVVYVPNAPVDAINHGPVCDSCGGAPISGNPIVTTLTDATGTFHLDNVPVGANIPLVMQVGKWRRQIVVPNVAQCTDTLITDKDQTRLPKNHTEGDMPLIALTGGCDPIHTLVQKIGVDPAEFTAESGTGMVRVYSGSGGQNGGVAGATDAYAFWGDLTTMMKYDIIINECECAPYERDTKGPAYSNMDAFLDAGGRVFNSHYHLNFFSHDPENPTGVPAAELSSAANWSLWNGTSTSSPYLIDTSFPKGKAMSDWMDNLDKASGWGSTLKTSPSGQVNITNVGDIGSAIAGLSQRWIYSQGSPNSPVYISINVPSAKADADRCGRAVATDLHVGSGSLTSMSEQEAALEFMFFDLASCVIPDGQPPTPPPPK